MKYDYDYATFDSCLTQMHILREELEQLSTNAWDDDIRRTSETRVKNRIRMIKLDMQEVSRSIKVNTDII